MILFYDGYEIRAEPKLHGRMIGGLRQQARFIRRTLKCEQVLTGFGTWFAMLRQALEHAGVKVRVNDYAAARRDPSALVGAAGYPDVLTKLEGLPNPRLLGPSLYTTPLERPNLFEDPRNTLILLGCKWQEDIFRPWYEDRVGRWFGGFDLSRYADKSNHRKDYDVLIYDKVYFDREKWDAGLLTPYRQLLSRLSLSHVTVRYGQYHHGDYMRLLAQSRCMAFFAHSETQGMAYQQCLSSGVPVFAWDEGVWPNPVAAELGRGPVPCTSVPYFSDECGMRFGSHDMAAKWREFQAAMESYDPRAYVSRELTLEASARTYLAEWSRAKSLLGHR